MLRSCVAALSVAQETKKAADLYRQGEGRGRPRQEVAAVPAVQLASVARPSPKNGARNGATANSPLSKAQEPCSLALCAGGAAPLTVNELYNWTHNWSSWRAQPHNWSSWRAQRCR